MSKIGFNSRHQQRLTDFSRSFTPKNAVHTMQLRTTTSDSRPRKAGLTNKVTPASNPPQFGLLHDTAFSKLPTKMIMLVEGFLKQFEESNTIPGQS